MLSHSLSGYGDTVEMKKTEKRRKEGRKEERKEGRKGGEGRKM